MKLRYNRDTELEVVGLGIFKPEQVIIIGDENETKIRNYLDSGYFDLVQEKKKKLKVRKSKKKGDDK